jgi:hypothetical protein
MGVAVGGTGVAVGFGVSPGFRVGVGVGVAGTGVAVGGTGVAVGGAGVAVGAAVAVGALVAVGTGVGVALLQATTSARITSVATPRRYRGLILLNMSPPLKVEMVLGPVRGILTFYHTMDREVNTCTDMPTIQCLSYSIRPLVWKPTLSKLKE